MTTESPTQPEAPHPLKSVLATASAHDLRVIVAREHATDLWTRFFLPQESGLREFMPPLGKTMCLLCDRRTMFQLAHVLEARLSRVDGAAPHRVIGLIELSGKSSAFRVEIVHKLDGLSLKAVTRSAVELFNPELRMTIWLPSPLVCLKVATHDVSGYSQPKEQDRAQLQALMLCNRGFLRNAIRALDNQTVAERKVLAAMRRVFDFTQSTEAVVVGNVYGLNWLQLFPVLELLKTSRTRLQRFFHELQAAFPSCPRAIPEAA